MIESTDTIDGRELNIESSRVDPRGQLLAVFGGSDQVITVDEYTIDLTSQGGVVFDVMLGGVSDADYSGARVDVIGPDGVSVVASSSNPLAANMAQVQFDQAIPGLTLANPGRYTLRVTALGARGQYVLALARNAQLDTEPNDSAADPLRSLADVGRVIGVTGAPTDIAGDWFTMALADDQTVVLTTETIYADPGTTPLNTLDPALELYDADGSLLAMAGDNAGDGRNAQLVYTAATSGEHRIRLFAQGATAGAYVLHRELLPLAPSLDVDDNEDADALTDGILIARHLFGFTGDTLTSAAVADDAQLHTPTAIEAYLTASGNNLLDVDGDGAGDALADGILIVRYLFGFNGSALIADAIATGATRTDAQAIVDFLSALLPLAGGSDAPQSSMTSHHDDDVVSKQARESWALNEAALAAAWVDRANSLAPHDAAFPLNPWQSMKVNATPEYRWLSLEASDPAQMLLTG